MTEDHKLNRSSVEALADKSLDNVALPHPLVDVSIWHLLTAAEDQVRMIFAGWVPKKQSHILHIDQLKYSLRHSVNHILKSASNDKVSLPKKTVAKSYEQASELLHEALKYEGLCRLIASTYNSRGSFIRDNNNYKFEYSNLVDIRYSVLEGLGHGADASADITGILHRWLTATDAESIEEKVILSKIRDSARIRNRKVTYSYLGHIAYGISQQVPQREKVIPDEFEFSWGKSYTTQALINSLLIRCLYHVLTVEITARKLNIKGGAESCLLLLISREQLCNDLQQLADFTNEQVHCFIDILIYGNKSKTPDLALQPLYLATGGLLIVPCYHILNSNIQRNLLALLAKTEPKRFDSQSSCFEDQMISIIEPLLKNWQFHLLNTEFSVNKVKEEIDVLILDEINKTILLLEFRWILQPGDAREVHNKIKATSSKVNQLSRKVDFFEKNLVQNIKRGFDGAVNVGNASEWNVHGIVVIQGFGGTGSHLDEIPIITLDIFRKGLREFKCLHSLYLWIKGLSWLPEEGKHFEIETVVEGNDLVEVSRIAAVNIADQIRYSESLNENIALHTPT